VPRREPVPSPNWSPHEWAPLAEAFNRIIASEGPMTPVFPPLYRDLLNGRLESALRQISRDGQETWKLLKPSDWRQWRVEYLSRFQWEVVIKVTPTDKEEPVDEHEHHFFVRRADLDKHYPARPVAPATASDRRTDDRRRKPGPKIKHNWKLRVATEAHRINEEERRIPTAKELAEFCVREWNYQPDESDIQKLLRNLLND
jgi:hypothetical protein